MRTIILFLLTCLTASAQIVISGNSVVSGNAAFLNTSAGGGGGNTVTFATVQPSAAGVDTTGESAPNVLTFNITNTSGNNQLLLVGGSISHNADSVVTNICILNAGGSNAMTQATSQVYANNSTTSGSCFLWYYKAPASGSNQIKIYATVFPAGNCVSGAVTLSNVNQTTPISNIGTNYGNSTAGSVTAGSFGSAQDMVVGILAAGSSWSANAQTLRWQDNADAFSGAGNAIFQTRAGGSSGVISATVSGADFWCGIAALINHD